MKTKTQGECHMRTKAETGLRSHKPGNAKDGQQTARSQKRPGRIPCKFQREHGL